MIDRLGRRTFLKSGAAFMALAGLGRRSAASAVDPRAGLDEWRRNMIKFGEKHGRRLLAARRDDPLDPLLGATYYDAQRVFYQIGDATKDKAWTGYAEAAMAVYRDRYVFPNQGKIPGYWNFTRGIAMHFERTGDPKSREAVKLLANQAAYAPDSVKPESTVNAERGRETAYLIHAKLDAEVVGEPRSPRLKTLVEHSLGHIDQWCVSKTASYVQPFMVGLAAEALIRWDAKNPDPRVLPALKTACVWLWNNMWTTKDQSFKYMNREVAGEGGPTPTPDLSLLIAPMYAWVYHRTGETPYRDRAATIFVGGVKRGFLDAGKQFNQNYRWSFDYVRWMTAKPVKD